MNWKKHLFYTFFATNIRFVDKYPLFIATIKRSVCFPEVISPFSFGSIYCKTNKSFNFQKWVINYLLFWLSSLLSVLSSVSEFKDPEIRFHRNFPSLMAVIEEDVGPDVTDSGEQTSGVGRDSIEDLSLAVALRISIANRVSPALRSALLIPNNWLFHDFQWILIWKSIYSLIIVFFLFISSFI